MHDADDSKTNSPWYLPVLKTPVLLHSSRDPGHCKLNPDRCAYKSRYWVFWYEADHVFALPTVYFFVAAIALFIVARFACELAPGRLSRSPAWRRPVSALRFLKYRTFRLGDQNSQSLGALLLATIGIVFFAALIIGPKPYYWPTDALYGNSPPIATRAGWLALACMPFVLVLSAKANIVAALTGVSHEKLNIWHNWISWAMFVLALIHTFPFVIYHQWKGDLHDVFVDGGLWITGVIALIAQAWLTFMSLSWIRNQYYEFFKATHLFFAVVFVVFFFLHCQFTLSSWDYFIASAVLYPLCLLYSFSKTYLKHGISHVAHLQLETPHTIHITINTGSNWKSGQHVLLRFLACGAHALTAHPFTICSLPSKETGGGELVFFVQPRRGLTKRLARMSQKQPGIGITVMLEGPYGGLPKRWYQGFDRTLIIGGGSGCGFTLSLIEEWLRFHHAVPGRQLQVVLATRDPEMRTWYLQELQRIAARQFESNFSEISGLSISFHETHHSSSWTTTAETSKESNSSNDVQDDEKNIQSAHTSDQEAAWSNNDFNQVTSLFSIKFFRGRPDTRKVIDDLVLLQGVSVGSVVCGPSSMVHDVASGAASAQQRIVRGVIGALEVWFHKEAFSY